MIEFTLFDHHGGDREDKIYINKKCIISIQEREVFKCQKYPKRGFIVDNVADLGLTNGETVTILVTRESEKILSSLK